MKVSLYSVFWVSVFCLATLVAARPVSASLTLILDDDGSPSNFLTITATGSDTGDAASFFGYPDVGWRIGTTTGSYQTNNVSSLFTTSNGMRFATLLIYDAGGLALNVQGLNPFTNPTTISGTGVAGLYSSVPPASRAILESYIGQDLLLSNGATVPATGFSSIAIQGGAAHAPTVPEPATLAVWSILGGIGLVVGKWQLRS